MTASIPNNVIQFDTERPAEGHYLPWQKLEELGIGSGHLIFYKTSRFGWVLTTLHISKSRTQYPDRTYGITLDGRQLVTVGRGPHVTDTCDVILSADNIERLMPYVSLWLKGMEMAGAVRDRIGSRRAQGQMERAAGKSYWRWNS